MVKRMYNLGFLVMVVILTVGAASCSMFSNDNSTSPIMPGNGGAGELSNFYASASTSDQFEAVVENRELLVNVPVAEDDLLTYKTNFGIYQLVLRATAGALLRIGLVPGTKVYDVAIQKGQVTQAGLASTGAWTSGNVTAFVHPECTTCPAVDDAFVGTGQPMVLLTMVRDPGNDVDDFWNQFWWDELTSAEQELWAALGWDQESWDNGDVEDYPSSEFKAWKELTAAERAAARKLGYDQESWDAYVREPEGDVETFWDQFSWNQLYPAEKELWGVLGWDEASWDGDASAPASEYKSWGQLTDEERDAARQLGYTGEYWNSLS